MLAGECLGRAKDFGGLLLLASCAGSVPLINKLADDSRASKQYHVSFISSFLVGDLDKCIEILIDADRLSEAAFFARTYCPSQVSRIVALWRDKATRSLIGVGQKVVISNLDF